MSSSASSTSSGGVVAAVVGLLVVCGGFALFDKESSGNYRPLSSPSRPVQLIVPSLHISAPIVPIEVRADGVLDPPNNYREVGWWQRSARPGSDHGQTVVTGHTVHTGGGQMDKLGDIRRHALIRLRTPRGTVWYREDRVAVYSKEEVAQKAQDLFGQDHGDDRLVLITCTDWTGSGYKSNIIVFASELGVRIKHAKKRPHRPAKAVAGPSFAAATVASSRLRRHPGD